jgi:prenyltransferase beta subunit
MFRDKREPEAGGISDRPDDAVEFFQTFFGVADTVLELKKISSRKYWRCLVWFA